MAGSRAGPARRNDNARPGPCHRHRRATNARVSQHRTVPAAGPPGPGRREPPRRRRNRLARPPVYRTLAGRCRRLLAAAVALRAYGVSGWWAALAAAVPPRRPGGSCRTAREPPRQAETAALVAAAGGWLVFVAAAGWTRHRPRRVVRLPGVPASRHLIGVPRCVPGRAPGRARLRAVKAARAAGMTSTGPAAAGARRRPRPAPARPGPDEGAVTEIAAVCGIPLERVRPVWAHLTEHGSITGPVAAGLIGMGDETGRRMLRVMERAGFVRKRGGTGEQVYVIVRAGLLHRVR